MNKRREIFAPHSRSRRRQRRRQIALVAGVGLAGLIWGGTLIGGKYTRGLGQLTIRLPFVQHNSFNPEKQSDTAVLRLASLPANQRKAKLEAIAQGKNSIDKSRARYLLAADLIAQDKGKEALRWLEGLESDYPVLGGYIAVKRAQAYEQMGEKTKALTEWQNLLQRYADQPVAADALYALFSQESQYQEDEIKSLSANPSWQEKIQQMYEPPVDDPKYWQKAVANYPSHPLILELAGERLQENPDQPELMLLLARYAFDTPEVTPDVTPFLDQLVGNYGRAVDSDDQPLIKPEDWQAIAVGYWRDRKYGQASAAYAKAAKTSDNAYLVARALKFAQKYADAKQAYKQMVSDFPDAEETPAALIELAQLQPDIEAVPYLDKVVERFPERAGEALLVKAETLERLGSYQAAEEARKQLIDEYGESDAAAAYRWQVARSHAKSGNVEAAWEWAKPITMENPHRFLARQAGFWVGKWARELGHRQDAQAAFEQVITNHPQSYYAWRSAVQLGWDVGDFKTVRQLDPKLVLPKTRPLLPVGSAALKELYLLGQNQEAWILWKAEFQNRLEPTVAEQFTDGLVQLAIGDYLSGISTIASLEDRDTPKEQAQYQDLREKFTYWQALYPFPFSDKIATYSQKRQLNPLLVTALIRQESRFEPDIRSGAGAVGLMQMMPSTGEWAAESIDVEDYSLENPDDNIKLGTWFLQQVHQSYNNNSLLAIASYNAGQGNLSKWLQQQSPGDPDEFVESIPFDETRDYVKQVFGNYWNYLRLYDPNVAQQVAQHSQSQSTAMRR
ncbi:MAG: transglycosylase SLT domain-containing protein [Coleofasciculus chthonoplastes F3-SA18-01]|uniref:lytic transglycosylase domain-containing protein n=1 Tax=Coleofasciculus chthonoplastes TaxID=64178 RepID=UPI0032F2F4EA